MRKTTTPKTNGEQYVEAMPDGRLHMDIDEACSVCGTLTGLACPDCSGIVPLCSNCDCPHGPLHLPQHAKAAEPTADTNPAQVAELTERVQQLTAALRGLYEYANAIRVPGALNVEMKAARAALAGLPQSPIVENFTPDELETIGNDLSGNLNLRRVKGCRDRWQTGYGSKTNIGLARMLLYNILPRLQAGDKNAARA